MVEHLRRTISPVAGALRATTHTPVFRLAITAGTVNMMMSIFVHTTKSMLDRPQLHSQHVNVLKDTWAGVVLTNAMVMECATMAFVPLSVV